ncbi:NADH dehydrogenase [ubiquinone] 1 beta subcomplex subunit 2, mitochondrial-like [Rhipicephalus microplus]|uniref:Putative nadh dehydrogenase ubiquinone 1 beta subcomplex subunit 2 mitochondrial n=1 Tax=Rhipicephalus microplus TaxID=6941 RepID=A0A6M2CPG4_RHIMP
MIGTLIRTAVVRTARSTRPIVVPVTRTSVRHSGGHGNWVYRDVPEPDPYDYKLAEFIMTVAWWWFFYHLITEPEHITGHFLRPPASSFTDAELGIPPDDED